MNLQRWARLMVSRRRAVLGIWVCALVSVSVVAARWGGEHRADYAIPGSDSAAAADFLSERLPQLSGDLGQLVFIAPGGVERHDPSLHIADVVRRTAGLEHVRAVLPPRVSADGTIAVASIQFDAPTERLPKALGASLIRIAAESDTPAVTVEAGGAIVQLAESGEAGSEQIGMLIALGVLLVAFGSVIAAGLPLLIAVFGVGVAIGLGSLLNRVFLVPDWAPQIVTMIGIGVGIDYALFVVVRFRSALAAGKPPTDAIAESLATSGRAVLFAGGTVVISLLGLCSMGMHYLYGTAAVTVTGVLVVVIAAMTLLPALLGIIGHRIDRWRLPFAGKDSGKPGFWARWSRVVQRRPVVTGTVALLALLALASAFTDLHFGYPDAGNGASHLTSRRAFDASTEAFGPGSNGPLVVTLGATETATTSGLAARLEALDGVAAVVPAGAGAGADASDAALLVIPVTGPQDSATATLIDTIRDDVVPTVAGAADVHVGGLTAAQVDESDYMGGRLAVFIGAVIALSFVLLLTLFRSLLVALKAALMNLLAIGAAYGVMAVALRGGWFGGLLGITEPTPIPTWAPMMMFALLFGLSMDYEVFLLTRIREEYARTRDNGGAVAAGIAQTGRVISAAALIMVAVFGAFILADDTLVKVIGLGLAVAVLLDATVVRMVLVPSTMELLGDRNWWLPGWLDRLLPHVDVEGHRPTGVTGVADVAGEVPAVAPLTLGGEVSRELVEVG
jgi:RND superfamily putative drug exporter